MGLRLLFKSCFIRLVHSVKMRFLSLLYINILNLLDVPLFELLSFLSDLVCFEFQQY